jgi:hypothetical protein
MTCYLLHARREKGKRRVTRVVLDKKRPQVYALALSRTSWYIYIYASGVEFVAKLEHVAKEIRLSVHGGDTYF